MTSHSPTKAPSVKRQTPSPNLEDDIRRRAYKLYEQRGREDGHELEDWLQAEEEITQSRIRSQVA